MFGHLTYLGLLLPWALPVLAGQWLVSGGALRRRMRLLLLATLTTTAYLVGCDAVALAQGIWGIHSDRVIGIYIGNVPIEEALFFLVTTLMVVQGVVLFNSPESRALTARRLGALRRRPR